MVGESVAVRIFLLNERASGVRVAAVICECLRNDAVDNRVHVAVVSEAFFFRLQHVYPSSPRVATAVVSAEAVKLQASTNYLTM